MPKAATKEKPVKAPRAKKDKDAPKRALSAYMFFVQDYRERVKTENPEASFGEIGKLLGAKWKEMDESDKKVSFDEDVGIDDEPYNEAATRDKVRASDAKAEYDAAGGSSSAPSKKAAAPKKGKKEAAKKEASDEEEDDESDE